MYYIFNCINQPLNSTKIIISQYWKMNSQQKLTAKPQKLLIRMHLAHIKTQFGLLDPTYMIYILHTTFMKYSAKSHHIISFKHENSSS